MDIADQRQVSLKRWMWRVGGTGWGWDGCWCSLIVCVCVTGWHAPHLALYGSYFTSTPLDRAHRRSNLVRIFTEHGWLNIIEGPPHRCVVALLRCVARSGTDRWMQDHPTRHPRYHAAGTSAHPQRNVLRCYVCNNARMAIARRIGTDDGRRTTDGDGAGEGAPYSSIN
jgi:hypothetical protein